MLFEPYADECTTFQNVRVLKFDKGMIEVTVREEGVNKLYKNSKKFKVYFNTTTMKVMNILQEVRFSSDKTKFNCKLEDLVQQSDIENLLEKWMASRKSKTD